MNLKIFIIRRNTKELQCSTIMTRNDIGKISDDAGLKPNKCITVLDLFRTFNRENIISWMIQRVVSQVIMTRRMFLKIIDTAGTVN